MKMAWVLIPELRLFLRCACEICLNRYPKFKALFLAGIRDRGVSWCERIENPEPL